MHDLDTRRCEKSQLDSCCLSSSLCVLQYGRTSHDSLDNDSNLFYMSMLSPSEFLIFFQAELFPNEIRGIGHSISFSIANILMFLAVQSYRTLLDVLGGAHAVQWFFAFMSIVGFFFGLCFLPETHNKKLSEIEAYFEKKTPARNRVIASDVYNVSTSAKEIEQMIKNKENA